MSTHIENLQALLSNRNDKYDKLQQRSIECDVLLTTLTDMVLGEDATDRSNDALCRAIRTLVNRHKQQVYTIARLEDEVDVLNRIEKIKYAD